MLQPNLTPGADEGPDLKSMFFNIYQGDEGTPEADAQEKPETPEEPVDVPQQPTGDEPDDSVDPADNDGDDEEYEIVEVDEDEVLEDDEVIDEDLEGDDDSGEESSESSEEGEEESEDGAEDGPGYLYHDEDEGREIFLKAVDPVTGESSIYLDRAEAERGLANQVAFIGELKKQVQEVREASNAKVAEMQKDLLLYQSGTNPEAAKEILVQAQLPEKFRNVDPATLSDGDLREFKNARLDAEIKVEREVREQLEAAQAADKANADAQDRADQHIRSRKTDLKFFGLKNVEDQRMVNQKLSEKPEGSEYSYSEIVTSVAKAFGNSVADQLLLTIVGGNSQTSDSNSTEKPKAEKPKGKKTSKPKADQVQKVKKKVRRKKSKPSNSAPATPDMSSMSARDILKDAFKQGKNKRVK